MQRIGILGAGAWGTALAVAAHRAGRQVTLWARRADLAAEAAATRENRAYLPGIVLDPAIAITAQLPAAAQSDAVLLALPAQHLRALLVELGPLLPPGLPTVICAKGIELETGRLLADAAASLLPGRTLAILSGPSFAIEVARGLPTAVTLACEDESCAGRLVAALGTPAFRPYLSTDVTGVQVGGAVKNVIAIACGIVAGRDLGDNARAALLTRGLAEIARLGEALGARRETLMGLSGLGDLTLTCSAGQSRNYSLGVELGRGRALAEILAGRRSVAEGVTTAPAVVALAARHRIEMPIAATVQAILSGADIDAVIGRLLARPFKTE